jgi:hypothetical protein
MKQRPCKPLQLQSCDKAVIKSAQGGIWHFLSADQRWNILARHPNAIEMPAGEMGLQAAALLAHSREHAR